MTRSAILRRSADDIAELLRDAKQVYDAIQGIAAAPPGVDAAAFLSEVRERLPELLLTDYLALELPALYRVLLMLNVIRVEHQAATANRPSFVRVRPDWSQIPFVLGHPQELPAIVYGWGTRDLNVQRIVDHLAELLFAFGLPVNIEAPDSALAATYAGLDDDAGLNAATSLVVPFWFGKVAGQPVQLAVAVRELPGTATALPGLVVEPQIPAQLPLAFPLSDTLALRLTAGTNAGWQVGILIRPHDVSIKYPFAPGTPPPQAGIGVGLDFSRGDDHAPGSARATRLELKVRVAGSRRAVDERRTRRRARRRDRRPGVRARRGRSRRLPQPRSSATGTPPSPSRFESNGPTAVVCPLPAARDSASRRPWPFNLAPSQSTP